MPLIDMHAYIYIHYLYLMHEGHTHTVWLDTVLGGGGCGLNLRHLCQMMGVLKLFHQDALKDKSIPST